MIKKNFKIALLTIFLVSAAFIISNLFSVDLETGGFDGTWTYNTGEYRCMGPPRDCSGGIVK